MKPHDKLWEEWQSIKAALLGDLTYLEKLLAGEDSPAVRRSYCRAVFAFAEGIAGWLKRYSIEQHHPESITDAEVKELKRREGALRGIAKALDIFNDRAGHVTPLKPDSAEWRSLAGALKIRNRLTHPEAAKDVLVSDEDLAKVRATKKLIVELLALSFRGSAKGLIKQADEIEAGLIASRKPNKAPEPTTTSVTPRATVREPR